VRWPQSLGGRGNEGVAALVKQTPNSIGYVEFSYARRNNIAWALVRNRSGAFPAPSDSSFAAAAAAAGWSASNGFRAILVDQGGAGTWPIVGATFILIPREYDAARVQNVLQFFDWAYKNGDRSALALDFVPVPDSVSNAVRALWRQTWPTAQF
jgi:phosphate transport system substrate-binding protein